MESNALEKSMKCCLGIFFSNTFDNSKCQNLQSCGSISVETVLLFPKKILYFRFETVEQSIINLSSNRSDNSLWFISHSGINLGGEDDGTFFAVQN